MIVGGAVLCCMVLCCGANQVRVKFRGYYGFGLDAAAAYPPPPHAKACVSRNCDTNAQARIQGGGGKGALSPPPFSGEKNKGAKCTLSKIFITRLRSAQVCSKSLLKHALHFLKCLPPPPTPKNGTQPPPPPPSVPSLRRLTPFIIPQKK